MNRPVGVDTRPGEYVCSEPGCTRTFDSAQGLLMHQRRVHRAMGPGWGKRAKAARRVCPYCNNSYVNVDQHIRNMHADEYRKERRLREEGVADARDQVVEYQGERSLAQAGWKPDNDDSGEGGMDVVGIVEQLVKRPMTAEERQWVVSQVDRDVTSFARELERTKQGLVERTFTILPFVVMRDEEGGIWHCERVIDP